MEENGFWDYGGKVSKKYGGHRIAKRLTKSIAQQHDTTGYSRYQNDLSCQNFYVLLQKFFCQSWLDMHSCLISYGVYCNISEKSTNQARKKTLFILWTLLMRIDF